MNTYFWSGYNLENFLLWSLNVSSIEGFSGVCLAIMSASLVYEGIRTFRDVLMDRFLKKRSKLLSQGSKSPTVKVKFNTSLGKDSENIKDTIQMDYIIKEVSKSKDEEWNASQSCCSTPIPVEVPFDAGRQGGQFAGLLELTVSTLLHMIHICFGYVLMLTVMTFNVWILVAVSIGTGSGFFIFDFLKRNIILREK